jgi:hypothetical protein
MYQYYILEVQKSKSGEYSHLVHYAFDADPNAARRKAESKYYSILAAAAVSDTAMHSAVLVSAEGFPILNQCYLNETEAQG